jgi:hypothetical protein
MKTMAQKASQESIKNATKCDHAVSPPLYQASHQLSLLPGKRTLVCSVCFVLFQALINISIDESKVLEFIAELAEGWKNLATNTAPTFRTRNDSS